MTTHTKLTIVLKDNDRLFVWVRLWTMYFPDGHSKDLPKMGLSVGQNLS